MGINSVKRRQEIKKLLSDPGGIYVEHLAKNLPPQKLLSEETLYNAPSCQKKKTIMIKENGRRG